MVSPVQAATAASMFDPSAGQASLIATGASVLSDAFGGSQSFGSEGKFIRDQYRWSNKNRKRMWKRYDSPTAKVKAAKAAGLHPLFSMGLAGSGMGGSPQISIPGQSQEGSFAQKGLKSVAQGMGHYAKIQAEKELVLMQNTASALRIAEHELSNDTAGAIVSAVEPQSSRFSIPLHPSKSESQNRHIIDEKGNRVVVPIGTPMETLEGEFGEWANVHPMTVKRFFKFLQNQDYIPSMNDLKAIWGDFRRKTHKQQSSTRKYFKNRDYQSIGAYSP